MAKLLKLRRGTTTQHGSFTGAEGELTIDTTKDTAVVHDGSQAGGRPLAREDMSNVSSSAIVASIGTSALAGTKVSPDFGSQDITTTGKIKFANVYSNVSDLPSASTYHGMFAHVHSTGHAYYSHGGNWYRLVNESQSGNVDISGHLSISDDSQIKLGGSDDLILYHQTSNGNSIIKEQGGGALSIQTNGPSINFYDTTNGTSMLIANSGGSVDLYHGSSARLGTTSSGVDVTGNISVSGTVDGRDIASLGNKLDGIENGATADQTASEIVSLINGQNITPGNLDVGTGRLGSDSNDFFAFSNNSHCDLYVAGSNEFRFESDGDFHADGDVIAQSTTISSDKRLKENIEVIPNALDKVQALNGVSFDWKKTGEKSAGVIAQEVQGVLPEAVKEVTPVKGGDSHLSVNYHALTSILIEAIKELKAEIEELKGGK